MIHAMAAESGCAQLRKFQGLEMPQVPFSNRWNFFSRVLAGWVLLSAATADATILAEVIPSSGPFAGGNTITITNGSFGTITNVLVGGVAATIPASGATWVTITMPFVGAAGAADIVVQTSDNGDFTLTGAYTVNPAGVIDGSGIIYLKHGFSPWESRSVYMGDLLGTGYIALVQSGSDALVLYDNMIGVQALERRNWNQALLPQVVWTGTTISNLAAGTEINDSLNWMNVNSPNIFGFPQDVYGYLGFRFKFDSQSDWRYGWMYVMRKSWGLGFAVDSMGFTSVDGATLQAGQTSTPGVKPESGSWTGGYPVVLSGSNLGNGSDITNVTLCGVSAASIVSQSATQVVVVAGVGAGGLGDVRVFSTSYGETVKSNAFTYLMPQFRLLGSNGAVIASGDAALSANGTKFPPLLSGAAWTNTFAITNGGTETLNISGFGNVNPRFEITGLPASVEVGGVSNFTVTFSPTSVGTYNDWLTISNDSPTSAYLLRLYGPCFGVWPNVGPFGGGNAVMIANGYFGDITNVLVDGVAATLVESSGSSFTIILPPATHAGTVSLTLQTSDNGALTLADAYTYNPRGWIGASFNTVILDNTSNGARPLANSLGSLTLNNWNAKVISTPPGEPTQLAGMKMSLYNTETAGTNTFSVGLYYVDASLNPLGAALVSTNITLNLTTTAAYYDIPLDAASWTLQPGTNYALVFKGSTAGVTLSWPIPGDSYSYDTANGFVFVEGRRTWDAGSSWDANFYHNGLQLLTKTVQSGVEPSSGSWTGGYEVVILGTNLCDGGDVTNVTLNGVSAASIVSQSATQVVVMAGAGTAGLGEVRVFSTSVGETVKSNAFTYLRESQAALVFNPASPQSYRSTNGLSVSGGSGTGVVSYAVNSGPGSIVGGSNLTVTAGAGVVAVVATRAQDDRYFVSSATALVTAARAAQTIVFPAVPRQKETNRVGLAASALSGLPVSFEVVAGPGRLSGGTNLSFTSFGRVRVKASQAGDADWLAAPSVTNTVLVGNALVLTDYSGDGGSDLGVYDDTATRWHIRTLGGEVVAWDMQWGYAGVQPVPGDYDGDGAADPAVYHPGTGIWHIRTLAGGVLAWDLRWGYAGAEPVPGDYDGDGQCDLAVYEAARGLWHVLSLNGPTVISNNVAWGFAAAIPVPGDYDGDGRYDLALYDADQARWYIRKLDGTVLAWGTSWGFAGATAVSGDYDGDGKSDLAVYDEASGLWYVRSLDGTVLAWRLAHGYAGAVAVPGDYDGDGIFDLGVYGSSVPELYRGRWHIRNVDPDALLWGDLWGGRNAFPVGAEP